ncbi:MAG: queuosine precursor transporter [Candidatus Amulumruptor caecigallinarius]|nr:queuosine precursor transporter [Candidatus Amulumruptor caecigallinarius]MCM1396152.1 queuosine precursor transporter [Candidatus Amulumruptor caecigallinarius]MCM1453848.1 queuosine precursor transporter [bacterium]
MEIKTVTIGALTLTAGVAVFPLSYIIGDCLVEIYGLRKASVVILTGFAMNLLTVLFLQLGLALPGSPEWEGQEAMQSIFGATPRILAASFTAFLAGSFTNALVMARMKRMHREGRFSLRAIISTLLGEGADSAIFFPIAFGGVLPAEVIVSLIVTQTFIKTAYEIIILPVTFMVVRRLRRIEASVSPSTVTAA